MVRLGQNFLADPNLLDAVVRDARLDPASVVLEVGAGEGALTERLAPAAALVHAIELDQRLRPGLEDLAARLGNVRLAFGDALRLDLAALDPAPTAVVSNLPYAIATPLILRTISELPRVGTWTVMVQREIAERLRAGPGSREYGAPSVVAQLSCSVKLLRTIDRAVFTPRPRVDSALVRLERTGDAPPAEAAPALVRVVRGAFAHRRKTLAGSLELAGEAERPRVQAALEALGIDPAARAEALAPQDFARLSAKLNE
jgi:16S rRNA (adenine1518-N6/adenine1519-N6)-dimethyltransferase